MPFSLITTAFASDGDIPAKFTCEGADVSPELKWSNAPAGAQSFALIVDDPDAPSGTWTHWVIWDIPATQHELTEGEPKQDVLPGGIRQGRNDFKRIGYGGPCPPPGKAHRYFFRLFALDTHLELAAGASRAQLERALQGHVLGRAELMGRYARTR